MKNHRLDENNISELLSLVGDKYPITEDIAKVICRGTNPVSPCTQVYGAYCNDNGHSELVAIMTATYSLVFPHEDGTRIVHISGAYTREDMRHQGYAASLIKAIEKDAVDYFDADYMCADSVADSLYFSNGFVKAPEDESRLWKSLRSGLKKPASINNTKSSSRW